MLSAASGSRRAKLSEPSTGSTTKRYWASPRPNLLSSLREQHTSGKRLLEIAPHTLVGGKVKGALDVSLGILPPGVRSILRCPKFPAELAMHVGKDSRHGGTECERVRPPRVHNPNH